MASNAVIDNPKIRKALAFRLGVIHRTSIDLKKEHPQFKHDWTSLCNSKIREARATATEIQFRLGE